MPGAGTAPPGQGPDAARRYRAVSIGRPRRSQSGQKRTAAPPSEAEGERTTAFEVNDVPTLLELVAHGLGVALVPEVVTRQAAAVRFLRLRPPVPSFEVAVATAGDPPASQAALVLLGVLSPG
jgi:DNA-binding transcriptional LysR family regulator